jgi:hypothetical protein
MLIEPCQGFATRHLEYEGREVVARFCAAGIFPSGRRFDLVRTRANGQPAFGAYVRAPTGIRHGIGLIVRALTGDRICAMTRFDPQRPVVRATAIAPEPVAGFRQGWEMDL